MAPGPKIRLSRRVGIALTPKASKFLEKRPYPPGEHGRRRASNPSDYKIQLVEKQRLRYQYDIREKQLKTIFEEAKRRPGQTGENLLQLLEARLDASTYRMGFAGSRAEARQLVRHNGILVNGKRVNIPSYTLKPGDVVELTEASRGQLRVKAALEAAESRGFPEWISVDVKAGKATFKAMPQRSELSPTLNEGLVIELYSK